MLQEGNYTVLEFYPPTEGMNRLIAPEALPQGFASSLENILPTPLGSATVRYGTRRLQGMTLDADASILEAFPFSMPNGDKQAVLYVQTFVHDATAQNFAVLNPQSFRFDTTNAVAFQTDTPVKIEYTHRGDTTLYSSIVNKTVTGQTVTITVETNSFPFPVDGVTLHRVSFAQGCLYVYDFQTATLRPVLKTGLSAGCVPRSVTFLNKLLICNGVDRVLIWDGDTLSEMMEFVKEEATQITRLDDRRFSFSCTDSFEASHYVADRIIQLRINGSTRRRTVVNAVRAGNTVTVTVSMNIPAFVADHTEILYQDWPPAFSFLSVAHNRLWALGPGAVGLKYRNPDQALRVHFSYQSNTLNGWFNPTTKTVPSINLAEGHGSPDNLEAIAFVNGLMVFMGRHKTQVWTGSEPLGGSIDPTKPKFEFSSLLPIGIVHGNLVVDMANDLYFVSQNGLLSFSTLNIARQFAATSSDSVDPLVRQYVSSTTTSNQAYRACRSFKYQSGAFCGFKIGLNKVLVSLYSANLYAWTLFSGDFAKAQTFLSDLDNTLYLLIDNQLYQYADSTDSIPVYGDNNGKDLISFLWTPPVINFPGKRYANKRYEIACDYPSSFVLKDQNTVCLMIAGDLRKTFQLQDDYKLQFKGDSVGETPFVNPADVGSNPNDPNEDALGFRFDEPYGFVKGRLKFLSSSFSLTLTGSTLSGPLVFKKIRLFGIVERSS
ncbi:hypothetical protein [Candidatus Finniella inopinata]|uniref:Uncharacterized protein n=1 Tax=Candidatus Finniella inopinata TaxID=1696036 RepID=A0A4Q7DI47_9PROT|nr:hypothetical protein [Candidatus Finniella inopinata]RZI46641.1 hypothetical protein EQU50_03385 [Candidatus Finniella inopinata]